jgi:hypothetical protein
MSVRKPFDPIRIAKCVLIALELLGVFYFAGPIIWYENPTKHWESQIRRQQNPAELQAWASHLIELYSKTTQSVRFLTNKPPTGIPISRYGSGAALMKAHSTREAEHIRLGWGRGDFLPLRGMEIGDTNFASGSTNMWKPGIFFFRSS